jgi:hypothetical protein
VRVYGGRSEINPETERTVRSSGGPGGRSATIPRTVYEALEDNPRDPCRQSTRPNGHLTVVDFMFLPLEFKRKQSVRASRTVREVRVFDITASNGKGSINTPCPGWESFSWHFERFILPCRSLPLLFLTHIT